VSIDREQLRQDLHLCAQVAEVACDDDFVRRSIEAFDDVLDRASMGMRTTTHPRASRKLNWRLGYEGSSSPLDRAREAGLRTGTVHPFEHLMKALDERFPLLWGVDFDVDGALDKVWASFPEGVSIDDLLSVPGFPPNVAAAKLVMDRAGMVGFHLGKAYVNVYGQVFPQGELTPRRMRALVTELGFPPPTETELACSAQAFAIYESYPYDHKGASPARISFATHCRPEEVPTQLHPLLERFIEKAPFARHERRFFFYVDYSTEGKNYKVATDYFGELLRSTEFLGQ
jgi:hypothetical protein